MILNFDLVVNFLVSLCVTAVIMAVIIDFIEFNQRSSVKREKKSIVETGSMFAFFIIFYLVLSFKVGIVKLNLNWLREAFVFTGLAILSWGAYFNIKGRFALGKNWSNQIKIYNDHSFVSDGPYKIVRHPLYASIIWMFLGASLVYLNYLSFFINIFIFIPFMYYRAKQEELLLAEEFNNYNSYRQKTGMFFPKLFIKK